MPAVRCDDIMVNNERTTGVSRRKILQAGAATAGMLGIGIGTASASDYEYGLIERNNHRKGVPFELVGLPLEPNKRFSCNPNDPFEAADCFDIQYEDELEPRKVAFETRDGAVHVGDVLVFGPATCLTRDQPDGRPWVLAPFEEARRE